MNIVLASRRKYMRKRTNPEGAPASVEDCIVALVRDSYPYTGQPITPQVTVTTQDGVPLVVNVDYFVSYSDNVNVGAGVVIVTGAGEYVGSVTKTFQITSAAPSSGGWQDFDLSLTEHIATIGRDSESWAFNHVRSISISKRQQDDIMLFFASGIYNGNPNMYRVCKLESNGNISRISTADEEGDKTTKRVGSFSSDGTKFAVINYSSSTLSAVFKVVPCSTPFVVSEEDIASAYDITCDVSTRYRQDIRTSPDFDNVIVLSQMGSSEGYEFKFNSFSILGTSAVRKSSFVSPHGSHVNFDVSPDGSSILLMTFDTSGSVTLEKYSMSVPWDVSTMTLVDSYTIPELSVAVSYEKGIAVSANGERLVIFHLGSAGTESRHIEVYNLKKAS